MDGYVVDVSWSPVHPNIFSALDCSGNIHFYDLNSSLDTPMHVQNILKDKEIASRFKWDRQGKRMALGFMNGHVGIYEVRNVNEPKQEDSLRLNSIFSKLQ